MIAAVAAVVTITTTCHKKISQHIGLSICKMYNFMYFDLLKLPIDIMGML